MTGVSKKRSGLDHRHLGSYLFINICSRLDPVAGRPDRRHSWAEFRLVGQPLDFLGNMASFWAKSHRLTRTLLWNLFRFQEPIGTSAARMITRW